MWKACILHVICMLYTTAMVKVAVYFHLSESIFLHKDACAVSVFDVWISDPPPLVAHAPRLSRASLFPSFNHPREALDTRLRPGHKLHLLLSTHIWPGDKTHTSVNLQVQSSMSSLKWNILKKNLRHLDILVTSPDIRALGHTNPNIEDHKHLSFSHLGIFNSPSM